MIVQSSTYDKNFLVELYEVFIIFSELQERLLTTQVIQVSQTEIFLQMHTGRKILCGWQYWRLSTGQVPQKQHAHVASPS